MLDRPEIDLTKPIEIEYILYVFNERDAASIPGPLRAEGFDVRVTHHPKSDPVEWEVVATITEVLDLNVVRRHRRFFQGLGIEGELEYDGWNSASMTMTRGFNHAD